MGCPRANSTPQAEHGRGAQAANRASASAFKHSEQLEPSRSHAPRLAPQPRHEQLAIMLIVADSGNDPRRDDVTA
jgi:hypothetical protein